jgi:hypothetical protein
MTGWTAPEGAEPTAPTPPGAAATGPVPVSPYGYGWAAPPAGPPAPRPGIIALRPLGLGEILDGSFTAIRTTAAASLGIAAVVMLVNQAIFLLLNYTLLQPPVRRVSLDGTTVTNTTDVAARAGVTYIATAFLTSIELLVLTGVMAAIVGERVVGRRVRLSDARAKLRPVAWPLARVVVIITLVVTSTVAVTLTPGIAVAASGSQAGPALIFVGFLVLIVPVVYAWTTLSLAPAAVVLERQGARAALRRSRKLVHGSWWRVFWISLLAWVIAGVVGFILSVPFLAAGGGFDQLLAGRADNLSFFELFMSAMGGFVGGTLARPFQSGVSALLYIDRRMRAEGLDLALQHAANADPT